LQNFPFGVAIQNWKDNKISKFGTMHKVDAWTTIYLQAIFSFVSFLISIFFIFDICLAFEFLDNK
jgi:hypothetical protein